MRKQLKKHNHGNASSSVTRKQKSRHIEDSTPNHRERTSLRQGKKIQQNKNKKQDGQAIQKIPFHQSPKTEMTSSTRAYI